MSDIPDQTPPDLDPPVESTPCSPDEATSAPDATATADQVMEAVFERSSRNALVQNERQHPRMPWVARITMWLRKDRWDIAREVQVKTLDISRGGFSFLHPHFLHADTLVSTRFDSLPDRPILTGIVKSCVYIGDGLHRVGVEFIAASAEG